MVVGKVLFVKVFVIGVGVVGLVVIGVVNSLGVIVCVFDLCFEVKE